MVRLFKAWSVVDNFNGYDQVIFNWFVAGRDIPVLPYTRLIENYDADDNEAWCDHLLVNELFTAAEIEELRAYLLNSHQLEVEVEENLLPVRSGGLSYSLLLINGEKGFYSLADEKEYDLSVSVLGHFELDADVSSDLLSGEDIQTGAVFLEKVFEYLKLPSVEQEQLSIILNRIYTETGLYVHKNRKRIGKKHS